MHSLRFLLPPTKLVPLSDCITFMCPRLEMNLLSASKNKSVDRSPANSMSIALVVRHVNKTPYRLARPVVNLVFFYSFLRGMA